MQRIDFQQIFQQSADEVLETMFFTGTMGELAENVSHPLLSAELVFHGSPSGRFGVQASLCTAQLIASNFLGVENGDLSQSQTLEVLGELTNMLCGSVLSRINANGRFDLLHPEVSSAPADWRHHTGVFGCTFALEEGALTVWIADHHLFRTN